MARVAPLHRDQVPELGETLAQAEERMGFVPNSMLTMARRPEIMRAFASLAQATRMGTVPPALKELVALVASTAAGVATARRTRRRTPIDAGAMRSRSHRCGAMRPASCSVTRSELRCG
jgi:hypothetical protein